MGEPIPQMHFFDNEGGVTFFTVLDQRVEIASKLPTMLDRSDVTLLIYFLQDFLQNTDVVEASRQPSDPQEKKR